MNVKLALMAAGGFGSRANTRGFFVAELATALRYRGDLGQNRASLRQRARADEGGGRTFHFGHSVAKRTVGGVALATGARVSKTGRGRQEGTAAAHMRYIERDGAVERVLGEKRTVESEHGRDRGEDDRDRGRHEAVLVHTSAAAPAQGYVENAGKLERIADIRSSFGTIGDTAEERLYFWELLEAAESHPDARIQHRLVLELPHEASPAVRLEMLRSFCGIFDEDHIPYWATIHAPGKKNDDRNYHAHVVYSERPAIKMIDPADPQKGPQWDFSITEIYRTKSRNKRTKRPFLQNKLRSYHARDFILGLRVRFCKVANAVLEREDVRDKTGEAVRYDARSYENMGLDTVPMRAIGRIVADKMPQGTATVLDPEYTKRMLTAELRDAAARRDEDLLAVVELEKMFGEVRKAKSIGTALRALPKAFRGVTLTMPSGDDVKTASDRVLSARRRAVQVEALGRATTTPLERVIAATAPKAIAAAAATVAAAAARNLAEPAEAPSVDAAVVLHAAALDELAATKTTMAEARASTNRAVQAAMVGWRELVDAPLPGASAAAKAEIEWATERRQAPAVAPRRQAAKTQATESPSNAAPFQTATKAASSRPTSEQAPLIGKPSQKTGAAPSPFYEGLKKGSHIFEPFKMPKWLDDLNEGISRMIRAATKDQPDVDKRMNALEEMVFQMQVAHRASRGPRPPGSPPLPEIKRFNMRAAVPHSAGLSNAEFDAKWTAERQAEAKDDREKEAEARASASPIDVAAPAVVSQGAEHPPTTPEPKPATVDPTPTAAEQPTKPYGSQPGHAEATPAADEPAPMPPALPAQRIEAGFAPKQDQTPSAGGPTPSRRREKTTTSAPDDDARQPKLPDLPWGTPAPTAAATPTDAPGTKSSDRTLPTSPTPAAEEKEPEHPADAKRRKAFEDEEKSRKKRRAVLAKRNRAIGR